MVNYFCRSKGLKETIAVTPCNSITTLERQCYFILLGQIVWGGFLFHSFSVRFACDSTPRSVEDNLQGFFRPVKVKK